MRRADFPNLSAVEQARAERPNHPLDHKLLFVVVTLAMVGLVTVYASTYHLGASCLKSQLLRAGVGLAALFAGTRLDHVRLGSRGWRVGLLLSTLGVLVATFIAGQVVGVAKRSLFGLLQPSEFAKFVLVLWLAAYFADLRESGKAWGFWTSFLKPAGVAGLVVLLTLLQPAAGTSIIMAASAFTVFFVAGVKLRYLLFGLAVVAGLGVGAFKMATRLENTKFNYILRRATSFDGGENYHQKQSLIAHGSGGLIGRGLGEGRQKYYFLPKLHKDFIFATVGEEFGFAGCLVILLLYLVLLYRGAIVVGLSTTTSYGQYLATGITVVIFLYSLVHEAVTLGMIPTTGQPLPFISYGGSALIANLFGAGVVLRISRFKRSGLDEGADRGGWYRRTRVPGARTGI